MSENRENVHDKKVTHSLGSCFVRQPSTTSRLALDLLSYVAKKKNNTSTHRQQIKLSLKKRLKRLSDYYQKISGGLIDCFSCREEC